MGIKNYINGKVEKLTENKPFPKIMKILTLGTIENIPIAGPYAVRAIDEAEQTEIKEQIKNLNKLKNKGVKIKN